MTYGFSPEGADATFWGQNKTGKTTIADAYFFLTRGNNSKGKAAFDIKTNLPDGMPEHKATHEVEGVFDNGGVPVELRCVYHEVYKQTRGKLDDKLSSNTTDYYIDGVKTSTEKEYWERVAEIMGTPQVFSLVSDPMYFINLTVNKKEEARALLMKHFSTLTDEEVFDSSSELRELGETLKANRRDVKTHQKAVRAAQKTVTEQKDEIPIQIKENKRNMPDISDLKRAVVDGDVVRLESILDSARLRLSGVDNGGGIADLSKKLAVVTADIRKLESDHYLDVGKQLNVVNRQISEIEEKKESAERKAKSIKDEIRAKTRRIQSFDAELDLINKAGMERKAEEFEDSTVSICFACKQPLPTEKVQEARERVLAAFNRKKAEDLTELRGKWDFIIAEQDRLKAEVEALQKDMPWQPQDESRTLEGLTSERNALRDMAEDYSGVKGHAVLLKQKAIIESRITAEREGVKEARDLVQVVVDGLDAQLKEAQALAKRFTDREAGEKRITELLTEEKRLAAEFERLKREEFLCDNWFKAQSRMAVDEVNGHFAITKWVLFETQMNEGTNETCIATEGGNKAGNSLNTGAAVNVGVDICYAFSRALGLRCPIVIDNAESVTDWFAETESQLIRFNAQVTDKTLRVETAAPERKRAGGLFA
jgi:hypothetical protein